MQADAYAGFYEPNRKGGPIIEAACWAHGRRKLFDLARLSKAPIAAEAVKRIDVPFAIEREINGLALHERLHVRQERSRPLIIELRPGYASSAPSSLRTATRPKRSITSSTAGMHSPVFLMTAAYATMPPNASSGPSHWAVRTGPSPALMRAAAARPPSTPGAPSRS
jgi:Transposase IS66 family